MLKILFLASSPLLILFSKIHNTIKWFIVSISLIASTFSIILSLYPLIPGPQTIHPLISIDPINTILLILTIWISILIIIASYKILNSNNSPLLFIAVLISLLLALCFCFNANNYITFYIFFESSLIPTLLLILMWGYQPERLQAGTYLILYTVTASLPLLLTLLIINYNNNRITIIIPIWQIPTSIDHLIWIWWIISIFAFLVKIPIFITHLWLPKAHVEAPIAGSIILAGVLLKLGSYGLIRISLLTPFTSNKLNNFLAPLCIWGAVITRIICLRQPDLKALIAYSSVGHIGILTAGLITCSAWGWRGALTLILGHGLCSSALFLLANITYISTNTRRLILTKGLLTIAPIITIWWFIFAAINIAAPPSINLLGEILLLTRILSTRSLILIPLILTRFLTGAYSLHIYTTTQHGPPLYASCPINLKSHSYYTQLSFHLIPLIISILKAETISHWFY